MRVGWRGGDDDGGGVSDEDGVTQYDNNVRIKVNTDNNVRPTGQRDKTGSKLWPR